MPNEGRGRSAHGGVDVRPNSYGTQSEPGVVGPSRPAGSSSLGTLQRRPRKACGLAVQGWFREPWAVGATGEPTHGRRLGLGGKDGRS